jgi:hypothetical protein
MSDNGNGKHGIEEILDDADQKRAVMEALKSIHDTKDAWAMKVMERELPTEIFALAQSKSPADKARFHNYLTGAGIRVVESSDCCQILKGSKENPELLGEFRVVREGEKMRCDASYRRKE